MQVVTDGQSADARQYHTDGSRPITMYDTAVIGGGIVGASVGFHLAHEGDDVLLVDRADEGRATNAGAGIVSPTTTSRSVSDTWLRFAVDAVSHYSRLVSRLEAEGIDDHGYAQPGLLRVAISSDEATAFERIKCRIQSRMTGTETPDPDRIQEIPPKRACDLFPPLADPVRVLHYRDARRVDGSAFTEALLTIGESHGLAIEDGNVERICVKDSTVTGVIVDGEYRDVGAAVIAGGAWSRAFGEQLEFDIPVEPQRGQIAHLDVAASPGTTQADTERWPIVSGFRDHYLVPWPDGRVAAGATREEGSGYSPRITAAGVREVLAEALDVAPGLQAATLEEVRVGLRPVSEDGLPILGPVPGVEGVYLATGHGPTGLQLGPYSGKVVADLVLGRCSETDITAFSPTRF